VPVASEVLRRAASALKPLGAVVLAWAVTAEDDVKVSVPDEPPAVTFSVCCDGLADGAALLPPVPVPGVGDEPPPPPPQAARQATSATAGQAIRENDKRQLLRE